MKHNPFRARQISPGRLPYFFPPGHDIGQLLQRFIDNGLRGQIVGGHGTGKSTLLQNLTAELGRCNYQVFPVCVTAETRRRFRRLRKSISRLHLEMADPNSHLRVITIDGCETATRWERFRFFPRARRAGWGVLVTTHQDLGLPTLWSTKVTSENARQVIGALASLECLPSEPELPREPERVVPDELLDALLARHQGDMREVLFSLYDWYRSGDVRPPPGNRVDVD